MKTCTALVLAIVVALPTIPATAGSIAERIAQEQAVGGSSAVPIKVSEGATIIGILANGPEVTYQLKLNGSLANISRAEMLDSKRGFLLGVCSSKIDLAGMAQGLTKKYMLESQAGSRATFTVSAADCGVKPGQVVQFSAADLQAMSNQAARVLPLKMSDQVSIIGVRADGMKYHQVAQITRNFDKAHTSRLAELTHEFGCANAHVLLFMAGGATFVWDWVSASSKPLGSIELTRQSCAAN